MVTIGGAKRAIFEDAYEAWERADWLVAQHLLVQAAAQVEAALDPELSAAVPAAASVPAAAGAVGAGADAAGAGTGADAAGAAAGAAGAVDAAVPGPADPADSEAEPAAAEPAAASAASAPDPARLRELAASLWFDAALAAKFRRDWPQALHLSRRAAYYAEPGTGDPAFWNLGIAATEQRDWSTARAAWTAFGIPLSPGEGEIDEDFGMTPVRLNDGAGEEVVWARRICPARAVVTSVPMSCDRSFGDVILHDGAPNGAREVDGVEYPVFDELAVWSPSEVPRWTVTVAADPDAHEEMAQLFAQHGCAAEPSSSMKTICECCSKGVVHQGTELTVAPHQQVWLAGPEPEVRDLLAEWAAQEPRRREYRELARVVPARTAD